MPAQFLVLGLLVVTIGLAVVGAILVDDKGGAI